MIILLNKTKLIICEIIHICWYLWNACYIIVIRFDIQIDLKKCIKARSFRCMLQIFLFYLHFSLFSQLVTVFAAHAKAWMFEPQLQVMTASLPMDWQKVWVSRVLKYYNFKRILDCISVSVCIACLDNWYLIPGGDKSLQVVNRRLWHSRYKRLGSYWIYTHIKGCVKYSITVGVIRRRKSEFAVIHLQLGCSIRV